MKRPSRRIKLQKETLRTLKAASLRAVAGGEDEHRTLTTNACPADDGTTVCV
jgi:hypothetical protein